MPNSVAVELGDPPTWKEWRIVNITCAQYALPACKGAYQQHEFNLHGVHRLRLANAAEKAMLGHQWHEMGAKAAVTLMCTAAEYAVYR